MNTNNKSADDFELTKDFTVADYRKLEATRNTKEIATFIRRRFVGRYLNPLLNVPQEAKSGFCTMAICCLMIEAVESFRQGWEDSKDKSKQAFGSFFDRFDAFAPLRGHADDFYTSVRCGILHQAETTNGWRIRREKNMPIFESAAHTIGANAFLDALRLSFEEYCKELDAAEWESDVWVKARIKLNAICNNCFHDPSQKKKQKGP